MPKPGEHQPSERVSAASLEHAVLIVTGSTLEAEVFDRPVAYGVRDLVQRGLAGTTFTAIVCSDIWYVNNDDARARPTISVGPPASNALAAYLADRVDTVFAVDGEFSVQLDLDGHDLVASLWGVNHRATAKAVAAFEQRYLDEFVRAAKADAEQ